ncbi:hypothetical protein CC79DRAFT_1364839 [Sarocladium strictum]
MPFVESTDGESRKRGWEEDDWQVENSHCLYSPPSGNGHTDFFLLDRHEGHNNQRRKLQPLMKRARTTPNDDFPTVHNAFSQARQSSLPLGSGGDASSFDFRPQPLARTGSTLTPCHICHRRPTKKSHLDSFAECQGCGEQTCFVCIRECIGWNADDGSVLCEQEVLSRSFHMDDADDGAFEHSSVQGNNNSQDGHDGEELRQKGWDAAGHRGVVCSRCCIERGAEGDIVCLGCLPRLEGA